MWSLAAQRAPAGNRSGHRTGPGASSSAWACGTRQAASRRGLILVLAAGATVPCDVLRFGHRGQPAALLAHQVAPVGVVRDDSQRIDSVHLAVDKRVLVLRRACIGRKARIDREIALGCVIPRDRLRVKFDYDASGCHTYNPFAPCLV